MPRSHARAAGVLAALAACTLAACGTVSSSSAPPAASSQGVLSPPAATPSAASLAPLTLASFPATADGRLARAICGTWAAQRGQYASRVTADTPGQVEQWLTGSAWKTAQADLTALGNAAAYSHLETAAGLALGIAASTANGKLMDKACSAGD